MKKAATNPKRRVKRAPTPAQLAARQRFAEMARAGKFTKRKRNPPAAKRAPVRAAVRKSPPVKMPVEPPRAVNPANGFPYSVGYYTDTTEFIVAKFRKHSEAKDYGDARARQDRSAAHQWFVKGD